MMAFVHHRQVSLEHFGPPTDVIEQADVELFSMRLFRAGERVVGKKLLRTELPATEVELGFASSEEHKRGEVRVAVRVPWTAERAEVQAAWRKLLGWYERGLAIEFHVRAERELDHVMARARCAAGIKPDAKPSRRSR